MKKLNRRKFLQATACATGYGILAGAIAPSAALATEKQATNTPNSNSFVLKNVRLETGFERDDIEVTATKSALFTITVTNGIITAIEPSHNAVGAIDAYEYLMLPATKDMHMHLDKTYYGGPWKARSKRQKSVQDMIDLEKQILPEMLKVSTYRAEKLIELLQSKGSCFARSHVNIEPTSQLKSLENLLVALENKKDSFGAELVAFPQHGLLNSKSEKLMEEAIKMGVEYVGGLDPFTIDGSIEKPIDFTVKLALDYNRGIDIHLHETGESGYKTMQYLIKKVNENPVLKGKTYISHAFAFRKDDFGWLNDIATQLAEARIGVTTSVPLTPIPIPTLLKQGIKVMAGTDCVIDHWQSMGTGSMLQKANIMAQLYRYNGDYELSRCLAIGTCGVTPLDDDGKQQWPKVGDEASFNLIEASCSAEAVARLPEIKALYYKGKCAYLHPLYEPRG